MVDERQFVVFLIGKEEFAVDIKEVVEIVKPDEITPLPETGKFIKGVINLRGNAIAVLDLALKLELPENQSTKFSRIIIINNI
jgi:purine-binding chemotaxis protein CheW